MNIKLPEIPLKNLQIVLVRAENPVNIGQTARAMKNFGANKLILVQSVNHKIPQAYTPGWKARRILDAAKTVSSLDHVITGSVLAIGFTARSGKRRGEPRTFTEMIPEILEALKKQKVVLVFGNEKNGLSNSELKKCHWIATLPAMREYSSLNLSHAVGIALFSIFSRLPPAKQIFKKPERFYVKPKEFDELISDFRNVFKLLGYPNTPQNNLAERATNQIRHYFKKTGLEQRELHLFKAFLSRINRSNSALKAVK